MDDLNCKNLPVWAQILLSKKLTDLDNEGVVEFERPAETPATEIKDAA